MSGRACIIVAMFTFICGVCGAEFQRKNSDARYCTAKCFGAAWHARVVERAALKSDNQKCERCSNPVKTSKSKYCSRACGDAARVSRGRLSVPEPDPVVGARWIPLTRGLWALVDEDDYERVAAQSWCVSGGYATSRAGFMHWFVMGGVPPRGFVTDHRNRDRFDNRRSNLRVVRQETNVANAVMLTRKSRSGFRGVVEKRSGWVAKYRNKYLGTYELALEAAFIYDRAVRAAFPDGEVELNFREIA